MDEKRYKINEVFHSIQGEGVRAGTVNWFIRFSACNLACDIEPGPRSPGGFACDTEFASGAMWTAQELLTEMQTQPQTKAVIFTGGEPALQLDPALCQHLRDSGYYLAIETNGSRNLDHLSLDWICVSPKVAEHALRQLAADEVKYVRSRGQGLPEPKISAANYVLSPAWVADEPIETTRNLQWCIQLCKQHPQWRLSLQLHKLWGIR